jgi:hypothetical protein
MSAPEDNKNAQEGKTDSPGRSLSVYLPVAISAVEKLCIFHFLHTPRRGLAMERSHGLYSRLAIGRVNASAAVAPHHTTY